MLIGIPRFLQLANASRVDNGRVVSTLPVFVQKTEFIERRCRFYDMEFVVCVAHCLQMCYQQSALGLQDVVIDVVFDEPVEEIAALFFAVNDVVGHDHGSFADEFFLE